MEVKHKSTVTRIEAKKLSDLNNNHSIEPSRALLLN